MRSPREAVLVGRVDHAKWGCAAGRCAFSEKPREPYAMVDPVRGYPPPAAKLDHREAEFARGDGRHDAFAFRVNRADDGR